MRRNKGQATLMYTMLIAVVVAAMLAMVPYIRRAFQAKYREAADVFGAGEQYERGVTF